MPTSVNFQDAILDRDSDSQRRSRRRRARCRPPRLGCGRSARQPALRRSMVRRTANGSAGGALHRRQTRAQYRYQSGTPRISANPRDCAEACHLGPTTLPLLAHATMKRGRTCTSSRNHAPGHPAPPRRRRKASPDRRSRACRIPGGPHPGRRADPHADRSRSDPAPRGRRATTATLIVYCHHGVRSLNVVNWLREQGVSGCQSMAGGIDRWSLQIDPSIPRYS